MNDNMVQYKPDWREARQRMTAWWEGKKTDRALARIQVPKKHVRPAYDTRLPQKFADPDTVFRNLELLLTSTYWAGEAFPVHQVYLGAMFMCTYFGCEPKFHKGGAWYSSPFTCWEDIADLDFDPQNRWYRFVSDLTAQSARRAQGRYLTSVSGISASFDLFVELCGAEETLVAMSEKPAEVKRVRDRIIEWGKQTYDERYGLVAPFQEGSIDGMGIWAPGRVRYVQCDLCAMISPQMFDDLVLPEIRAFTEHVDYGIYHLDGEEQVRHLNSLLTLDALKVIQYVPSAAKPSAEGFHRDPMEWIDVFRRIQDAGKKLWISCPPQRIRPLFEKISPEGVFLWVVGCKDEQETDNVLRELDRIGM